MSCLIHPGVLRECAWVTCPAWSSEVSFLLLCLGEERQRPGHFRLCPLMKAWSNSIGGDLMSGMINIQSVWNYFLTPADHALFFAAATSLNEGVNFQQERSTFPFRHSNIPRWAWGFSVLLIQPSPCWAQNFARNRWAVSIKAYQWGYLFFLRFTELSNIEVVGDWGNLLWYKCANGAYHNC